MQDEMMKPRVISACNRKLGYAPISLLSLVCLRVSNSDFQKNISFEGKFFEFLMFIQIESKYLHIWKMFHIYISLPLK